LMCASTLSLLPSAPRGQLVSPHTYRIARRGKFDSRHRRRALMMLVGRALRTSALTVVLTVSAAGADYYVSPTGDDGNDGTTPETPYKEVQTGLDQLAPGDTLYLMPGMHIPSLWAVGGPDKLSFKTDGTAGAPIRLTTTDPGVVLDLRHAHPGYWGFSTAGHSYIVVDGGGEPDIWDPAGFHLKICNVPGWGNTTFCFDFRLCHDVILRNVWCDQAEQSALFSHGSYNCLIENVVASNDGVNVNSHGFHIALDSHNLTLRRFRAYGWGKHGIQFLGGGQYGHTIDQCVLGDSKGNAIKNLSAADITVTNSFLYSTNGFSENRELVGIEPNAGYDIAMTFTNCSFYSNYPVTGRPLEFLDLGQGDATASFFNCVIYTPDNIETTPCFSTVTGDYNLFFGGICPFGANASTGDPLFVNTAAGDLHIGGGSAAIDAASAVFAPAYDLDDEPRPYLTAPDLGADELVRSPDLDGDGDVDLDDFVELANVMAGPNTPTANHQADLDADTDCDLADVAMFATSFTGQQ